MRCWRGEPLSVVQVPIRSNGPFWSQSIALADRPERARLKKGEKRWTNSVRIAESTKRMFFVGRIFPGCCVPIAMSKPWSVIGPAGTCLCLLMRMPSVKEGNKAMARPLPPRGSDEGIRGLTACSRSESEWQRAASRPSSHRSPNWPVGPVPLHSL